MAKIGSTMITMPSLNFGDSNELMNDGLKTLLDAFKPVQTQMDANFAERQSNATGSLLEQISQGMPQDYNNNPEARALFDSQISQFAAANNLSREGVNKEDVFSILSKQSGDRDTARQLAMTNKATASSQRLGQLANMLTSKDITQDEFNKIAAMEGLIGNSQLAGNEISLSNIENSNAFAAPWVQQQQLTQAYDNDVEATKNQLILNDLTRQGSGYASAKIGGSSSGKQRAALQQGSLSGASSSAVSQYSGLISNSAKEYGLPDALITSMLATESSGDPNARSSAGASGLMQVMPATFKMMTDKGIGNGDINDPANNIKVGTAYMAEQMAKYSKYGAKGIDYALMAYNWGPGKTDKYIASLNTKNPMSIPTETKNYLAKVKGNFNAGSNQHTGATSNPKVSSIDNPLLNNFNPNDYISYDLKGKTRNQKASKELTDSVTPVLADMGITMKVHSGGQDPKGKTVGGPRHNHGNAVDADFFIGNTQLDPNNPEHVPILTEMVQKMKANGITGFGNGEGYMGGKRMHIGFGNPGVWGKDETSNSAAKWLKDAVSGSATTSNSNVDIDALYSSLNKPVLSPMIADLYGTVSNAHNEDLKELRRKIAGNINPNIPNPVTGETNTGYISPEMLRERNTNLVESYGRMEEIQSKTNKDMGIYNELLGKDLNDNAEESKGAYNALELAIANSELTGGIIDANEFVTDTADFNNWLKGSGSNLDMFEDYDGEAQKEIISAYLDRQEKIGAGERKASKLIDVIEKTSLNTYSTLKEQSPDIIQKRDAARREEAYDKGLEDNPWFGRSDKEKYLDNLTTLENTAFNLLSTYLEENKESYIYGATKTYAIGNSPERVGELIDLTLSIYDKKIKADTMKKPKDGIPYLSKNLTKDPIYKVSMLEDAAKEALDRKTKAVAKGYDKAFKAEDPSIKSLTEIVRRASLRDSMK